MFRNEQQLNQAIERLTIDVQPRPAHRDALRAKMLQAFEQAQSQEPARLLRLASWLRRSIMNPRYQRIAAAAAILVAILGTFTWRSTSHAGVVFADIVRTVQKAHSATFTLTITGAGPEPQSIQVSVLGNRVRQEHGGGIEINEPAEGRSLALMPDRKAVLAITKGLPPREVEDFAQNSLFRLRERLTKAAGQAEDAGSRQIEGQTAKGFRVQDASRQLVIWADATAGRLLQVDWLLRGGITFTMKDFRFGVNLDEGLFSFTPPAGYKLFQMNLSDPAEKDLLYYLRVSAESRGGVFPTQIWEGPAEQAIIGKDWPEEKVWELRQNIVRGKIFREMTSEKNYAGGGVTLGDADRPIFWYRPTNASMYRVIYGDLSVQEVTSDALPEPATPGQPKARAK